MPTDFNVIFPHVQGGPKKLGRGLMTIILSNLNRLTKLFSLKNSLVNLQLDAYQ